MIVPVFNPGAGFDELIDSLDNQRMDPKEFEVILCDDGSGEATRDRLAQAAATRPNIRVLALPHTGWPGTPRNHGIEVARGKYVFFSDQDDRLFEGALQDLCDYADRYSSDVVVGKVVGVGRRIPRQIFRRDIPRAELGKDPLLELLTPHKLFRTSFLREHGIRFPDGRVRLEDHLFVMHAYFNAKTISVLASRPCYAWVKNKGSASSSRIDPATYFPHLLPVLDLVESRTAPGPMRDALLRHWYRGKILNRLDGRRVARYPDEYRSALLDVVVPIARDRFGPGVERGLPFPLRIRSALLRADRRDELLRFAEFEAGLECRAEVTSAKWTRGGRLDLTIEVRVHRDGEDVLIFDKAEAREMTVEHSGSSDGTHWVWRPPAGLGLGLLPLDARSVGKDLLRNQVEVVVLDALDPSQRRFVARAPLEPRTGRITLDPLRVFDAESQSRGERLLVHVRYAGWSFDTALRADQAILGDLGRSPFLAGRTCRMASRNDGTLELRRQWPAGQVREDIARGLRHIRRLALKVSAAAARRRRRGRQARSIRA